MNSKRQRQMIKSNPLTLDSNKIEAYPGIQTERLFSPTTSKKIADKQMFMNAQNSFKKGFKTSNFVQQSDKNQSNQRKIINGTPSHFILEKQVNSYGPQVNHKYQTEKTGISNAKQPQLKIEKTEITQEKVPILNLKDPEQNKTVVLKYQLIEVNGNQIGSYLLSCSKDQSLIALLREDNVLLKTYKIIQIKILNRDRQFVKFELQNLSQSVFNFDDEIFLQIIIERESESLLEQKMIKFMLEMQQERQADLNAHKLIQNGLQDQITKQLQQIQALEHQVKNINLNQNKIQKDENRQLTTTELFWANQESPQLGESSKSLTMPDFSKVERSQSHGGLEKVLVKKPSIIRKKSSVTPQKLFQQNDDRPDLIFFYSEPLVDFIKDHETGQLKMVSTSSQKLKIHLEYRKLTEILKSRGKSFKISQQAINFESLKEMVARRPQMLHISCHGDYCEDKKEFYLQFEGIGNGKADKFYQSRLLTLLGEEKDHGIKLAFVSACHSEEIGNILRQCNIPIVIAVNSIWQVADEICLIFSRHLYMQLLNGVSVRKAFLEAQRTCTAAQVSCKSCCCAHDHSNNCKWKKYAIKHGYEKAHELHSGKCSCKLPYNMHKNTCKVYQDFKSFLRDFKESDQDQNGPVDPWAFDEDFDFDNFETNLNPYDSKAEDNILCCCQKNLPHDETLKFILKGEESRLDTVLFKNRANGQLTQMSDQYNNNKIPNIFDLSNLIGRNIQIQKCVETLTSSSDDCDKFIKLYSRPGEGKQAVAKAAIKYCTDRNFFRDGAYQIALETQKTTNGFLNQLFQEVRLNIYHLEDMLDCIKNHHMVILLSQIDEILQNDKEDFQKLLTKILLSTNHLKIIMLIDHGMEFDLVNDRLNILHFDNRLSRTVVLEPLNNFYSAMVLKQYDTANEVLQTETVETLSKHRILQENSLTCKQIQEVYMLLKSEKTLDQIHEILMTQKRRQSERDDNKVENEQRNFHIKRILYQHMVKQYPEEKILLHLLCQAPAGLTLLDIKDQVQSNPRIFGDWEEFIQDLLCKQDSTIDLSVEQIQSQSDSSELSQRSDNQEKKHGFKVIFQKHIEDLNQSLYFLEKNVRTFVNEHVLRQNRPYLFFQFVKYFSRLGRQYIRNLNLQSQNSDFDLFIMSAQIDQSIWDKPKYTVTSHLSSESDIDNIPTDSVVTRFNLNEPNFQEALNYDLIISLFKSEKKDGFIFPQMIQYFDELYITFVSILIILNREQDAINTIQAAKKICKKMGMRQTHAKLKLILVSLEIKSSKFINVQVMLMKCHELFKQDLNSIGLGECQLLWAIWHISEYQMNMKLKSNQSRQEIKKMQSIQLFSRHKSIIDDQILLDTPGSDKLKHQSTVINENLDFSSELNMHLDYQQSLVKDQKMRFRKIIKSLDQAQQVFQKFNQAHSEARVILIKAQFLESFTIQMYTAGSNENTELYQEMFNDCLDDLLKAQKAFEKNFNIQHQIQCLIFIGQICMYQNEYQNSKQFIQMAHEKANEIRTYQQVKQASNLLKIVRQEIQISSNNAIMHLLTNPIVYVDESEQVHEITSKTRCFFMNKEFEIKQYSTMIFNQMQKHLVQKLEILNENQLDYLREYGCRILTINSQIYDSVGRLCIEDKIGRVVCLDHQELFDKLQPKDKQQISIDVVFINIQNGEEIANVFKRLGVPQIFTFSSIFNQFDKPQVQSCSANPPLYETCIESQILMEHFTRAMILKIIDKQSFYRAYESTLKEMEQSFDSSLLTSSIKWMVGDEIAKGTRLYDDNGHMDERKQLKYGQVEDQSSGGGPTNLTILEGPFIGRKKQIYEVTKQITDPQIQIIKIIGSPGSGKTKFVKTVASHINLRGIISDGVYYIDFQDAYSQKHIDDLFLDAGINKLLHCHHHEAEFENKKQKELESCEHLTCVPGIQPIRQSPLKQILSTSEKQGSTQSQNRVNNLQILLIYDNIDQILENLNVFNWHIKQLMKKKVEIKLVVTSKKDFQVPDVKCFEVNLQPLSMKESNDIVEFYSMKYMSHSTAGNKVIPTQKENNIKLCEGNPRALLLLAFILRTIPMDKISIEYTQLQKQKSNPIKVNQSHTSIQKQLQDFNYKQLMNQVRNKIYKKIQEMMLRKKNMQAEVCSKLALKIQEIMQQKNEEIRRQKFIEKALSDDERESSSKSNQQILQNDQVKSPVVIQVSQIEDSDYEQSFSAIKKSERRRIHSQKGMTKNHSHLDFYQTIQNNLDPKFLEIQLAGNQDTKSDQNSKTQNDQKAKEIRKIISPFPDSSSQRTYSGNSQKSMIEKKHHKFYDKCPVKIFAVSNSQDLTFSQKLLLEDVDFRDATEIINIELSEKIKNEVFKPTSNIASSDQFVQQQLCTYFSHKTKQLMEGFDDQDCYIKIVIPLANYEQKMQQNNDQNQIQMQIAPQKLTNDNEMQLLQFCDIQEEDANECGDGATPSFQNRNKE